MATKPKQLDLEEAISRADAIASNKKQKPLNARGQEIPDPTPMAPPVGYKKQKSMVDIVRDMVRSEHLRRDIAAQGFETFEDADDFEVGDDYDPKSPHELDAEYVPASELARRAREEMERDAAAHASSPPQQPAEAEGEGGLTNQPPPTPKPPKPAKSAPKGD